MSRSKRLVFVHQSPHRLDLPAFNSLASHLSDGPDLIEELLVFLPLPFPGSAHVAHGYPGRAGYAGVRDNQQKRALDREYLDRPIPDEIHWLLESNDGVVNAAGRAVVDLLGFVHQIGDRLGA